MKIFILEYAGPGTVYASPQMLLVVSFCLKFPNLPFGIDTDKRLP